MHAVTENGHPDGRTERRRKRLMLSERQTLFADLVRLQDAGMAVPDSRQEMARRFRVTVEYVKIVEAEGIERGWVEMYDEGELR